MTLGTDGAWSGRFWHRQGRRQYDVAWCDLVRVVGNRLSPTFHPELRPPQPPREELQRTIGVWGHAGQAALERLHVGIVGLGSVGSLVCEALVRMGVRRITLIDYDIIELLNLDRVVHATHADIGRLKVEVAAEAAMRNSPLQSIDVRPVPASVVEEDGYRAALDCDVLFSCVDRPWPRRVLNHISYAHLLPVIDGGIWVRVRRDNLVGADWQIHTVGPERRCLECLKAFDPSLVGVERDGWLEDPTYLSQLDPDHILVRHENVFPFSMNVASLEVLQLAALILGTIPNLGNQNYHFVTGNLDRADDEGCERSCPYQSLIATGDTLHRPIGLDHAAEGLRRRAAKGSANNEEGK